MEPWMPVESLPYVVLVGFLFGTSLIASRFSVGQFEPVTFIGLRLAMASAGHAAIYTLARRRRWPTDHRLWRHAAVLGIFGTAVPMTAIVSALQVQSGGVTSVLITANPALTVLMAHFFLPDESLNRIKSLGVILALGGAFLLAARGESGLPDVAQADPRGYALVFLSIVSSSSMTIYARRFMRGFDAFDVASVRMFAAAVAILPLSALLVGFDLRAVDGRGYLALVYGAFIGTFLGFMMAFYNIKRFGATASAMTAYIIPIFTGFGGVLLLGETLTPTMLIGFGIIASGIAIINRGGAKRRSDRVGEARHRRT
jgi:drug/metabolite transporter (DMT)-like permease